MIDYSYNRQRTLGYDGHAGSLLVLLWPLGKALGHSQAVVFDVLGLSERVSFVFVGEDVVGVFHGLEHCLKLELNEENRRKVVAEGDIVLSSIGSNLEESVLVAGDEETSGVDNLCVGELSHVCIKVRHLVLTSSSKVSAESPLLVHNHDSTSSSGGLLIFVEVAIDASFLELLFKHFSLRVLADGAEVGDSLLVSVLVESEVGSSCGVEGRTSGNGFSSLHVPQFIIDWHLLLASQGGHSPLKFVLFEDRSVRDVDGDVEKGISDEENLVRVHFNY